jgi:outer membrane protein assembly factor BamB
MREDFVTRLEHQLTSAERLQERGGRLGRRLAPLRAWRPSLAAGFGLAAAAAVLVVVALGAVALTRGGSDETAVVAGHRPTEVARTWLSPNKTITCISACDVSEPYIAMASGFGAAWVGGVEHGDVVRLDADTHRVTARIPVGRLPSGIVTTRDAVWVLTTPREGSATLVRIDPARNRVTDRVAAPAPAETLVPTLLGDDRALWVLGWDSGVRFDLRRSAVAGRVTWNLQDGAFARTFGLADDDLWVRAEDGQLLRLDAHTGARKGQATSPPGVATLAVIPDGGVVVANADGTLTRIDASNGRALWSSRPAEGSTGESGTGRTEGTVTIAGDTVWALAQDSVRGTVRLTAVDIGTGRTLTATALEDLGAGWLTPVGGALWYIAPQGYAVVVRP